MPANKHPSPATTTTEKATITTSNHHGEGMGDYDDGQTDITTMLNGMLAESTAGVYTGGKGVIVRNLNDGLTSDTAVVPGSFLVNDIKTPSTMYPDGDPKCPNNGWSGYNKLTPCTDDPFTNAVLGIVIGTSMDKLFTKFDNIQDDDWGYGVFYGTDSNSVDQRCRWVDDYNGYDCPGGWQEWGQSFVSAPSKKGSGNYASGNPIAGLGGGGAGCHFSIYDYNVDQFDGWANNQNLVGDQWCQCNYKLKGNGWGDWVEQWVYHGQNKPGFEWMGWFGKGAAPTYAMDIAMCWVNNPRDMILMQNAMWYWRDVWNNLLTPQAVKIDQGQPSDERRYWGWNEVPLDRSIIDNPLNWDALVIKMPAAICGGDGTNDYMGCLSDTAQQKLEDALGWYVERKLLIPGADYVAKRPGSYIVMMKEWHVGKQQWERGFFCGAWTSPSGTYEVVYSNQGKGACYVEWGNVGQILPSSPQLSFSSQKSGRESDSQDAIHV